MDSLVVLGLNKKEKRVLNALLSGFYTPLAISRETCVSRPAVYHILERFSERGIVTKGTYTERGSWRLAKDDNIERLFLKSKNALSQTTSDAPNHVLKDTYGSITVYRGKRAVRSMVTSLFGDHKNERFYVFQGIVARKDWEIFFTPEETDALNEKIKDGGLIMDAIFPIEWVEKEIKEFGIHWAKAYEGRTARAVVIDPQYFTHGGTLFMFKDSIYLFTLKEKVAIEIKNSEIQKMIFSLFKAVSDQATTIDINAHIRELTTRR